MIETIELMPGITLRCFRDSRFKQNGLTFQIVRPLDHREAAMNALIPAVLLRGCKTAPDLRAITLRLDDLYGASIGALARKVGDYQTTGLSCGFISDHYTLGGEALLAPMVDFLRELLLEPVLENGVFNTDFVESEKKNLISTIDSQLNNKRTYAVARMNQLMCKEDPYGVPRLGRSEDVKKIDSGALYRHYQKILRESRMDLFYVGDRDMQDVAELLRPVFRQIPRDYCPLAPQTTFRSCPNQTETETLEVSQGKLVLGFTTPLTLRTPGFYAMQVLNTVLGAGMTSKLFMTVREKMSLCYDISSGYTGSKGIMVVSSGIDFDKDTLVKEQILAQIGACCDGDISDEELTAAKEALCTSLRSTHDSPGSIESYYATGALSGSMEDPDSYMQNICAVTKDDVVEAAKSLSLHTVYFLKGVS